MAITWLEEVSERAHLRRPMCSDRHEVESVGGGAYRVRCGASDEVFTADLTLPDTGIDQIIARHLADTSAQTILDLIERLQAAEATVAQQHETLSMLRHELSELHHHHGWPE